MCFKIVEATSTKKPKSYESEKLDPTKISTYFIIKEESKWLDIFSSVVEAPDKDQPKLTPVLVKVKNFYYHWLG